MEQTLLALKPDAVMRRGVGAAVLGRVLEALPDAEFRGFLEISVSHSLAEQHYAVHKGKFFYEALVNHICSCPVVAAVIEGPQAISIVRAMVGATRPWEATPGTIRGDFALQGLRNLIHASDAPETAESEITLWFKPTEITPYPREIDRWLYE